MNTAGLTRIFALLLPKENIMRFLPSSLCVPRDDFSEGYSRVVYCEGRSNYDRGTPRSPGYLIRLEIWKKRLVYGHGIADSGPEG